MDLISIPPPPQSCPPAAYEFALLLAERIQSRRLKGKVLVLDASTNPQPQPLAAPFEIAFQRAAIEYVPSIRVARLETGARRVHTADGESFGYDLACLIPPHKAARFIEEAGLAEPGDPFRWIRSLSAPRATSRFTLWGTAPAPRTRARPRWRTIRRESAPTAWRGRSGPPPRSRRSDSRRPASVRESRAGDEPALDLPRGAGRTGCGRDGRPPPGPSHVAARRAWQQQLIQDLFGS